MTSRLSPALFRVLKTAFCLWGAGVAVLKGEVAGVKRVPPSMGGRGGVSQSWRGGLASSPALIISAQIS